MMELCAVRVIHNLPPIHTHAQRLFPCTRTHSPFLLKHTRFTSVLRYCVNSPLSSTASGEISTKTADKPDDGVVSAEGAPVDEKKQGVESDERVVTPFFSSWEEKKEDSGTKLYEADESKTDSVVTVENAGLDEKKEESGVKPSEPEDRKIDSVVTLANASVDEKKEDSDTLPDLQKLLDDLGIKIDFEENKNTILTLGGGGLLALWLASAIVGAIDRVPLLPKVLELVGLGYSIWFTIRYIIFEESRGELVAKFERVKQEIFGSDDD